MCLLQCLCEVRRSNSPADLPASAREHLTRRAKGNCSLPHSRESSEARCLGSVLVKEEVVDLVGYYSQLRVATYNLRDGLQLDKAEHLAERVVWGVEEEHLRLGSDGSSKSGRVKHKVARCNI